ncbi:hypothetical protein AGLY_005516 [Aphis glycines]|uniref:Uncharacterized protein n=1 Tax=Aphis glycines TaxID=307491 RepID=A0A6G0TUM7_APHGL|nr:hypothetical protein AGLY_005516 [Aphis glycines]
MLYYFCCLDNFFRPRTRSEASVDLLSDILIDVFNTPSLISVVMQNPRSNYSPEVTASLRRILSKIVQQSEFIVPSHIFTNYMAIENTNSNENNIVPSTSNSNNQRDENRVNIYKKPPVFDDFIKLQSIKKRYRGHRNTRTLFKEATFWGNDFIMSGSDCGHLFVWDRYTCEIVMLQTADSRVVNCIQPHPSRLLLATSGVDHNVKLWSPQSDIYNMIPELYIKEIAESNTLMVEQSRDTITVSPSIIMRMLFYFNKLGQS